jgi:hypothetical protein
VAHKKRDTATPAGQEEEVGQQVKQGQKGRMHTSRPRRRRSNVNQPVKEKRDSRPRRRGREAHVHQQAKDKRDTTKQYDYEYVTISKRLKMSVLCQVSKSHCRLSIG